MIKDNFAEPIVNHATKSFDKMHNKIVKPTIQMIFNDFFQGFLEQPYVKKVGGVRLYLKK